MSALAIGFLAGIFCYLMVTKVKAWFSYDDSLDAFGVHGAGGTLGAVLTGVFASSVINPVFHNPLGQALPAGLIEGNWHQVFRQLTGVAIAWFLSIVGTLALLKVVDVLVGLRLPHQHEVEGLDLSQHGEEGYDWTN
jgi:ammonium transporter, Amt family